MLGPFLATQAAVPAMRKSGGGVMVNVSSIVSKMHILGLATYASTKAALNILSETARYELERYGIKVCTVFPRMTSTDFGKNSIGSRERRQQRTTAATTSTVDSAEHVAGKILQAIQTEAAEQFMDI